MKSPCIKVCEFDQDVCRGCGLQRAQIKAWKKLDNDDQRSVLAEADLRLLTLAVLGRRLKARRKKGR